VGDPIFFHRSLDVSLDHGIRNTMAADISSVAYWYQTEPHEPFPALPSRHERYPRVPWSSFAQWATLAALFAAFVELARYAISHAWG
jgi:hypothetical protein